MKRVVCIAVLLLYGIVLAQAQGTGDNRPLGDIAREAREQKRLRAANPTAHSAKVLELIADISVSDPDDYESQMTEMLERQDFAGLDKAAESARSRKSRFPGGVWKLYIFYQAVSTPPGGKKAGDAARASHIMILKQWVAKQPESSTALIALAEAYMNAGWQARGGGYADEVTEEGWQGFGQNAELARQALEKASHLGKCPYWYEAMLHVAVAQSWSKARLKSLFEEAMAFDSGYYHTIREYANYLQPKWYGANGEVGAFANEISERLGGDEGAFVYFEIASLIGCPSCGRSSELQRFSWPKVKEGYAAMEHQYGVSSLKVNRFAFMATSMNDREAAKPVFARIGSAWNQDVWKKESVFAAAKAWALAGQ